MPGWAFGICSTASTLQILIWVMGNHDQILQKIPARRHPKTVLKKGGTVAPRLLHTPSREKRRFLNFNHLSKEFLEQMIPHLKALI